jgi:hypothetical protein
VHRVVNLGLVKFDCTNCIVSIMMSNL